MAGGMDPSDLSVSGGILATNAFRQSSVSLKTVVLKKRFNLNL